MAIQWFPGHMHKAQKEIRKLLPGIDLFIEILDARIPHSSENPLIAEIKGNKPGLKLLHKADLADPAKTQQWIESFHGASQQAFACDQGNARLIASLPEKCHELAVRTGHKERSIHALIVGIPNVGKSTLINLLAGRSVAKTGNEPAITRAQQKIDIGQGVVLCDTPGVLWANLEHPNTGYRLATLGSIRETAIDYSDVACFAAEMLLQKYPDALLKRYGPDIVDAAIEVQQAGDQLGNQFPAEVLFLEALGRARGCLETGDRVDMDRVSRLFLAELRAGTLGRLTLETPADKTRELKELEQIRASRQEKQKKRIEKRKRR